MNHKIIFLMLILILVLSLDRQGLCENLEAKCGNLSPEACATSAYKHYRSGNQKLGLDLSLEACLNGSSTGCYNSACYYAEKGQISQALDSLKRYFSFPVSYPIFSNAVEDSQLQVLFADSRIAVVLDQGNSYFACSPVTQFRLEEFDPGTHYSWNGRTKKFFNNYTLPQLAVKGCLAFYEGDVTEAMKYFSDLAICKDKAYQSLGLKMASILYGHYIDKPSQILAKATANAAIKLGATAGFLKELADTGIFPPNYCKEMRKN